MTQTKESIQRIAEFNALFLALNEKGQEAALTILESLRFAQSVMNLQNTEQQYQSRDKGNPTTEIKEDSSKQQLYISSPNRKKITHNNQNMECKELESSVQITLKDIEENASLNHFG